MMKSNFYIGWDVGGWNCDKNGKSRDAIVILDGVMEIVGTPWRGNLREQINESSSTEEWITSLFRICLSSYPSHSSEVCLGIDTPLGFSREFIKLITEMQESEPILQSATNSYLYRETERFLFRHGLNPLSSIKDMIGSQATKGMHVLAKFAPNVTECGIWSDNRVLTAIEAYPSACKNSVVIKQFKDRYAGSLGHSDKDDALTCALIAYIFSENRAALAGPPPETPEIEGWIWVPKDGLLID